MPLIALSVVLQLICLIHCMRSGNGQRWAWILIIGSYIAVIAYVVVEVIPNLRHSRVARQAARGVTRALDPERERRRAAQQLELNDSIESRRRLAEELLALGDAAGAIPLYQQALAHPLGDDPHLHLGLATAQYQAGDPATARQTLETLIRAHPQFRSSDGHFLYARCLLDTGAYAEADHEFAALLPGHPGEEARVWYAQALARLGRVAEARTLFQAVLQRVKLAPAYYRREQKAWIRAAEHALLALPAD